MPIANNNPSDKMIVANILRKLNLGNRIGYRLGSSVAGCPVWERCQMRAMMYAKHAIPTRKPEIARL